MNNRITCIIINEQSDFEKAKSLISQIVLFNLFDKVFVFSRVQNSTELPDCEFIQAPPDINSETKLRNYINQFFRKQNFDGFLHVMYAGLIFNRQPDVFVEKLEQTMKVMDYDVYFNTICDGCNYIYSRFNPRVIIDVDVPEFSKFGISNQLIYTSHANTEYIVYNMKSVTDDQLRFDDRFTIAMYFIIEYLARRRNTKKANQLYLMNQYLTIPEEIGLFKSAHVAGQIDKSNMQDEDTLFKQLNINYQPDNNIDMLLEQTLLKLQSKI